MRKEYLFRSIARYLDEGTTVVEAAYMWKRHRLMLPFAIGAFVAMVIVAAWAGWDDWPARLVIGLAGAAIAVASSTDYRIVAQTTEGMVLLRASRIRQVATGLIERLPPDVEIDSVGGTVLNADWNVAGTVYTVPRSSENAINRIAARA